jgi:hypothetical protein
MGEFAMGEPEDSASCAHAFQHQGVKWWEDPAPRPGTGALTVRYYDAYFCGRCLESKLVPLDAGDRNSYQEKMAGSSPVSLQDAAALRKKHGASWY